MGLELWHLVLACVGVFLTVAGAWIKLETKISRVENMVENNKKDIDLKRKEIHELKQMDRELSIQINQSLMQLKGDISDLTSYMKEKMARLATLMESMEKRTDKLEEK